MKCWLDDFKMHSSAGFRHDESSRRKGNQKCVAETHL